MKERVFPALIEQFDEAMAFLEEQMDELGVSMKVSVQISIAFEEMFVNVAHYAYPDGKGDVTIQIWDEGDDLYIRLIDSGIPFDPVAMPEPDISLSAEERKIGGLGIYMVKKSMDELLYERSEDKNIVTIKKKKV